MAGEMTMTKDEALSALTRAKNSLVKIKEAAEAPLAQGMCTLSGIGGGVASGVIRAYVPEVYGIPVDGALGVAISVLSLLGAGEKIYDATAVFGVGLAAPAFSRGTEALVQQWRTPK